jgi:hypothetical protein
MGLVLAVLLPMLTGLVIPESAHAADSITTYALLASVVILPFSRASLRVAFWMPLLMGTLWGIWRMAFFDPLTKNDIPGIGYFVLAFVLGIAGMMVHRVRDVVLKGRHQA